MNTLTAFYDLPKEWEVVRLLDITHIFDGTHQTPQYTHHGVAFFSVENIANNKPNKFISQQDYLIATSKNKPEYNDILLTRIGAIGISKVVSWTYPFSIYVTLAVIKQSKYFNSYYLHYFIQSSFFQKELKDNSLLQAIPCKINMDKLKKCKVILPPLNEQSAIANILSALDRYLYALDALILKKEGVKKALSFELLSQRKRLKGFNQAWQRVKVKDFGIIITGSTPLTQISEYWNGTISWITPTDINDNKDIFNSERKITQKGLNTIRMIPKNSVLVTCIASIGKNAILRVNGACNQQINAIIPNKDFNADFIYYLMENNKQYLLGKAGVTATYIISKQVFEEIDFFVPKDLNEQSAIANILSALDNEIASLKNKKRQFENIKKALNHDLMSAKIRVLKK
ncbi:restriction modification system DNA specificity domain protein [Helicobacter pylori Shi169]|uniref:Restriction modification system DNA specificity domain protein n=1 Tax=Helicobacter pylori Shi169 TaxID=1163741 RepID=A0A0E0WFH1_HELPX|nr:restriction endonuclease subunit S [Helicobacter pylori]AFI00166.1 restriction modification system DNA specificity domain protein [Helicobacter pylori Shi169]